MAVTSMPQTQAPQVPATLPPTPIAPSGRTFPEHPARTHQVGSFMSQFFNGGQMFPGIGNLGGRPRPAHPGGAVTPPTATPAPAAPAPAVPQATPQMAADGLNGYSDSAGYDYLLNKGTQGIYGSQAGQGIFQTGATGEDLENMRFNLNKTYLDNYIGHTMDLAKLGLGTAGAVSGAGGYQNNSAYGQSASNSGSASNSSSYGNSASQGASQGQSTSQAQNAGQSTSESSGKGSSQGQKQGIVQQLAAAAGSVA